MPDTNSFDDILGTPPTSEEKTAVTELQDGGVAAETPEQARIRQLEETIARLEAKAEEQETVRAAAEGSGEQAQALQALAAAARSETTFQDAGDDDIVFHVLVNGLTIAGAVRHPGETVRIQRGSQAYQLGKDRTGYNWLDDISEAGQLRHFGKVVLGEGPFQGKTPNDALAQAEASRRGSAVSTVL